MQACELESAEGNNWPDLATEAKWPSRGSSPLCKLDHYSSKIHLSIYNHPSPLFSPRISLLSPFSLREYRSKRLNLNQDRRPSDCRLFGPVHHAAKSEPHGKVPANLLLYSSNGQGRLATCDDGYGDIPNYIILRSGEGEVALADSAFRTAFGEIVVNT